jgi:hypothetical protein
MSDDRFGPGKSDSSELNIDALLKSTPPTASSRKRRAPSKDMPKPDLEQTASYASVGEALPELPPLSATPSARKRSTRSSSSDRSSSGSRSGSATRSPRSSYSPADDYAAPTKRPAAKRRKSKKAPTSDSRFIDPANFKALEMRSSNYKIRGGGSARMHTPLVTAILAAVVIVGFVGLIAILRNTIELFTTDTYVSPITLTEEQTRSAIDEGLPLLKDIVWWTFDDILETYTERGDTLFVNERYIADAPDYTASGKEIVRMPTDTTEEQIQGFYEGKYNAYDIEELQTLFNGAWTLDVTHGDKGEFLRARYVNLAAKSIEHEMDHLQQLQGLTGDGVTLMGSGVDDRGNSYIEGSRTDDEATIYWRIAACPFDEVYSLKALPDTAVYISCTVASYNFFTTTTSTDGTASAED